jgi:MFS family permease
MSLQAAGLGWIAAIAAAGASYPEFLAPLLIAGIGISLALPVAPTAVLNAVGPRDMGKASGVNSTLQRFGSAFAIAVAAAVFSANGHLGSAASFTSGFRAALMVVAGLSLVGAFSALATARR